MPVMGDCIGMLATDAMAGQGLLGRDISMCSSFAASRTREAVAELLECRQ